jgi:hypothetical protein
MQDGQEDGTFDGELEAAFAEEGGEEGLAAGLLPEVFEDQGWPDPAGGDDRQLAVGLGGSSNACWAKRAPEASKASSWPEAWRWSSRPRVARTRCLVRPSSQKFSTSWR